MFELNQWVLVNVTKDANGKFLKHPINAQGQISDAHNPINWHSYVDAKNIAAKNGWHIGFALTESDPYFCLDIDHCLMPSGEEWNPLAQELCRELNGGFVEVSVSGASLHIWGKYSTMPPHKCKNTKLQIELYHSKRFIVLGHSGTGDWNLDFSSVLPNIISKYFPGAESKGDVPFDWTFEPIDTWCGYEDDIELVDKAREKLSHANIFGKKVTFAQIWDADVEALASAYPSDNGPYDGSSADAALAQRLAFWTGNDCERILRLMWTSNLVRDKWELREDYLRRTILNACARQERVCNLKGTSNQGSTQSGGISRKFSGGFINTVDIPEVFEKCIYIIGEHKVLVPGGSVINPERFKVLYGGYKFMIDDQRTTRNAWEAFTECPSWRPPTANGGCFRPELPPCELVMKDGDVLVNTYFPLPIERAEGDVSKFLQYLNTLYPVKKDQDIILAYIAAIAQYPGKKFQWAPVLQGPEGSGKTFLIKAVTESVGEKYCHTVNPQELSGNAGKFTAWLNRKLFVAIEEIKVGNKHEIMEILKPLITNQKVEIQAKGADQYMGDNRANFMFTTNYTDALNLKKDMRRYCPIMSVQQTAEDLVLSGMTPEYFFDLWDWADGVGAYANQPSGFKMIANFLLNYDIPDALNPATLCNRAPKSSAWDTFIQQSAGRVEQEILEAVGQGLPGFSDGWISSMALDSFLSKRRLNGFVPINRRKALLESLGYIQHPHLPKGGRVTTNVAPDGGKPRLFVKKGSLLESITEPRTICETYSKAQVQSQTDSFSAFASNL